MGEYDLNPAGWGVMITSLSSVLILMGYCLVRVLTLPPIDASEYLKAPLDIDTRDTQDAD
jgi:hypothetical protein